MILPIYEITNFSFAYPYSTNKNNIKGKFIIYQGEHVLIQGKSGYGKSTLLMALKGLIPHLIHGDYSGEILFKNKNIININELDQIGYLAQNPHSWMTQQTVYEEMAFGLENLGYNETQIHSKIKRISRLCNLSDLLKRDTNALSSGEKQKINLMSILLTDPKILLLDEPTAFLDPCSAVEIVALIKQLCQNKTVVIVEHNTQYLHEFIDQVIVITEDGKVESKNFSSIPKQISYNFKCKAQAQSAQIVLKISNLNFSYPKGKNVLHNINIDVHKGEIIAIKGNNGAGKSTLLKLIAKLLLSKNSIWWKNTEINNIANYNYYKKIGLLWSNSEHHFLHLSVEQELHYNTAIINMCSLSNQVKINPFNLSEGQKRRLSIGTLLLQDVELLLLDEPTFGQDHKHKQQIGGLISDLTLEGKSFIIVSHDMEFINQLTNKIYYLENKTLIPCH